MSGGIRVLNKEEYKNVFDILVDRYPKLFIVDKPLLLKVGIFYEIPEELKVEVGKTKLRKFFQIYCTKIGYDKLHILGADRYDLNGEKCDVVTKEHMELRKKVIPNKNKNLKKIESNVETLHDTTKINPIDGKEVVNGRVKSINKKPKLGLRI
jgi:sRNA-binding protein